MEDRESFYRELLDNVGDGLYFTDGERRISYWNKEAERITGYSRSEVLGRRCMDNLLMHVDGAGNILCHTGCPLRETIADGQSRQMEVFLRHKDGHRVPVFVRASPIRDETGTIVGAVETFSDNSAKNRMEERLVELEKLSLLDALTGLANRRYIEEQIQARLEELRRYGWPFGLLFVDIDHFKAVNDRFGHEVGDKVLRMVGKTLDGSSRYFDLAARWGGEEFLVLLGNTDASLLPDIGERFRALIERSALSGPEDSVRVTVSIGGTVGLADDTVETLVRRADQKLYEAKQSGRNRICI
jgi:diguanylate cyclase (GGDEF)-like protein/PAS domain S-box-containing protein